MMTQTDFKAIADILVENMDSLGLDLVPFDCDGNYVTLCQDFADYFAKRNPAFKRERFLEACQIAPCHLCGQRARLTNHMGVTWCESCKEAGRDDR